MDDRQQLRFQVTNGLLPNARQWQRIVQERLGHHGISSACIGPFMFIGRSDGGLHQVMLAQQLGIEGPSLVRLLDKLAAAGLVRRESDANDRRANQLWLTEAGRRLHRKLEQGLTQLRADVLAALSDAELRAVLKLYRLIDQAATRVG
ncbi:MarR family winged helix-turn-helix transcriptional regulator [Dyella sp. KRB-257]|uniref:MarR family winged helix-turn-helix transcriptional regulator n=1 Tax=Dyella sp. KRB-257 TaxID=3400915 RepID=UPI003C0FA5C2